ncbi:MAG: acyltransferase [Fimbriimonas ginsengisoli]|uniref:Acyltransferase n=1 Tax=Fimbriimonas ginsengisoli TaxID=1005039 RepID=A0A931LVQ3_FIMGI|nr:acyltransferase [Fimbriimonas ginsengisoli]
MRPRLTREESAPRERFTFIEGMRGLAALYVVLGHLCSMSDPEALHRRPTDSPAWLQAVMAPFWHGHLAVAVFIVISGFCLQAALFPGRDGRLRDVRKFLKRRAWRILPPYYACLALSLVVAVTITSTQQGMPFDQYLPVTKANVIAHALMIHNLSPDWMYKINGVLWSIGIEFQLYFLFPLLVAVLFRVGRAGLVAVGSGVAGLILLAAPGAIKLYPWYLALFAVGMAAAHLAYRPALRGGVRPAGGLALAVVCGFGAVLATGQGASHLVGDALAGLAGAGVLYAGVVAPQLGLVRVLSRPSLVALGTMSYTLYLMHHPIEQIVYVNRPAGVQGETGVFLYLLAVGLPVILVGCAALWWMFERPFQKLPGRRRAAGPLAVVVERDAARAAARSA